ncbi:hypothetical protein DV736_g2995, partial [Chaetothyriales sp. CBS 134916]
MPPNCYRPPLHLSHVHIPGRIPYTTSVALQSAILAQYFAYRKGISQSPSTTTTTSPGKGVPQLRIPLPTLLTFSTPPTYTVGRRHLESNPLSPSQIRYLTRNNIAASFHASSRGGLLTYHGPGQLTAYPLIDLRAHGLGARQYVRLLEDVVIDTCKRLGVPNVGVSCTDPGVWMVDPGPEAEDETNLRTRKVCALGVQVTRGVSSHGIGLNVFDEDIATSRERERYVFDGDDDDEGLQASGGLGTVDEMTKGYLSWGFGRIVACGLEGKATTWLSRERERARQQQEGGGETEDVRSNLRGKGWDMARVASVLAECLRAGLRSRGKVDVEAVDVVSLRPTMHSHLKSDAGEQEQEQLQKELLRQILGSQFRDPP